MNNINENEQFTLQWLVIEAIFWGLVYKLFFTNIMRPYVFKMFARADCFDDVKMRSGTMLKNMADEVPLVFTLGTHHTIGGLMMLIGSITGNSNLWVHGALMEYGCELFDLTFLIVGADVYATDAVKPEFKKVTAFHHLPGVTLMIPLVLNGFHTSPHLQQIGAWLLLAGGFALLGNGLIQTLNFSTHMPLVAFSQAMVTAFIGYARMWVFPRESYAFFNELNEAGAPKSLMIGCGIAVLVFSIFNMALFSLLVDKASRYIKRAITGISSQSSLKQSSNNDDEKEHVPKPALYGNIAAETSNKQN